MKSSFLLSPDYKFPKNCFQNEGFPDKIWQELFFRVPLDSSSKVK